MDLFMANASVVSPAWKEGEFGLHVSSEPPYETVSYRVSDDFLAKFWGPAREIV